MKALLSEPEKIYIIKNYELKSLGKLSEEMKRSRSGIYYFYKKWLATNSIQNKYKNCGRKKFLSTADSQRIEDFVDKNPHTTALRIRKSLQIKCSDFPIKKCLKKLGFKNLRLRHKPILSNDNREKRLSFAKKYKNWSVRKWNKVLFSDKSSVQIGKVYLQKIWVKPENRSKPGFYLPKKQDYGKKYVKVWSCFSSKGVGELHFIEDGWNRHVYKSILNERLKNEANRLIGKDYIFQQDGDTVHISKVVATWLRKNQIQLLEWPPSSCDLSPIENLWWDFKRRLSLVNNPSNKEQFLNCLLKEYGVRQKSQLVKN